MSEPLNLGDSAITAATAAAGTVITSGVDESGATTAYLSGLGDILSALLSVNFVYGAGGTSVKLIIENSIDQGTSWIEVYRAAFTTASGQRLVNLSALTAMATPYTPAALSDDTAKDGIIGDRWRARYISVGTYSGNTSISVRMQPKE